MRNMGYGRWVIGQMWQMEGVRPMWQMEGVRPMWQMGVYYCNEYGEVKGQDHTRNEQTQSVDDIIWSNYMVMYPKPIPVTTGDFI